MGAKLRSDTRTLVGNATLTQKLNAQEIVDAKCGLMTVKDILEELAKPAAIRAASSGCQVCPTTFTSRKTSRLAWVQKAYHQRNPLRCLIDIGVHQDALIHISSTGQRVCPKIQARSFPSATLPKIKVLEVDLARKRISVTRKL